MTDTKLKDLQLKIKELEAMESQLKANEGYFEGYDLEILQILRHHLKDRIANIKVIIE